MPDVFVSSPSSPPKPRFTTEGKTFPGRHQLKGHSHSSLAAFNYYPDSVRFVAKEESEEIILLLRRHPITNLGKIFISLVLILAPLLFSVFPIFSFLPARYQFVGLLFWYIIVIAYTLEFFLDWFFNVCVLTNETVFDVDFTNLIYREISEADFSHVQDVTVRMGGVFRTIFDYGDVYVQTAGEVPRIEFEAIPHPDRVARIIRDMCSKEERK